MSRLNGTMEKLSSPPVPSYLLIVLDMVVSFAKGHMTYEEYREKLDAWWKNNEEAWQEDDLACLFRLICLTD